MIFMSRIKGMRLFTEILIATLGIFTFCTTNCLSQGFQWPEEPKNLKVLPEDAKGQRLGEIMRGFSTALGTRCEHCHVGEEPDLSKFDFASDEKIAKLKARLMIEMVQAINQKYVSEFSELEDSAHQRIEVTCMTCHRSQTRPLMLDDILYETVADKGVDSAVAQYKELRDEYYGGFTYDFSPSTLIGLGERLGREKNFDAALRILNLEIETDGESYSVYYTLGSVQAIAGMREDAINSFSKGMELAPDRWKQHFQKQIDRLQGE